MHFNKIVIILVKYLRKSLRKYLRGNKVRKITYRSVVVQLQRDKNNICFSELQREGFNENQVVNGLLEISDGKETRSVWLGECVAYLGYTCNLVNEADTTIKSNEKEYKKGFGRILHVNS